MYVMAKGPIPDGLTLDHLCRVRHCVNPDHLEPVTQTENRRRGVRAQVPSDTIQWLRQQPFWLKPGRVPRGIHAMSLKRASRFTGVPQTTIRRILAGEDWR